MATATADPAIEHAARDIAAAQAAFDAATEAYETAAAEAQTLEHRLAQKRARHAELQTARANANGDESNAAELYGVAQDIEALKAMVNRARQHADSLAPDREQRAMNEARDNLRRIAV